LHDLESKVRISGGTTHIAASWRGICAEKVLLNLVNLKTKHTGDGYP